MISIRVPDLLGQGEGKPGTTSGESRAMKRTSGKPGKTSGVSRVMKRTSSGFPPGVKVTSLKFFDSSSGNRQPGRAILQQPLQRFESSISTSSSTSHTPHRKNGSLLRWLWSLAKMATSLRPLPRVVFRWSQAGLLPITMEDGAGMVEASGSQAATALNSP